MAMNAPNQSDLLPSLVVRYDTIITMGSDLLWVMSASYEIYRSSIETEKIAI